jgi:pyruvate dehydrogenase E2 component (dihydrolipoamide acetyltransferase)
VPVEIVMPKLGLTMASGTIARWIKAPGEAVREGEPLVEVSTDKITYEVESPASGTVARSCGKDGDEFACGDVIGYIALAGESDIVLANDAPAAAAPFVDSAIASGAPFVEAPRVTPAANGTSVASPGVPVPNGVSAETAAAVAANGGRVVSSPAARRLARELGVALSDVRGTGPRGRITIGDVQVGHSGSVHAVPGDHTPAAASVTLPPRLPAARRAIYRKMTDVGRLPLAQVETVARVDAVHALMQRRRDFGWTAFAVYVVARLLGEHVDLRTDATTGAPFDRIDIGVAADTPHGLIVPVVRDADRRSLAEIQREIVRLAALARDAAIGGDDVGGACFSISNVGPQSVERVSPLPDPPQTAILGIGAATQRPALFDPATERSGGEPTATSSAPHIVAALMLTCVVSFDHRFIDGAPAARFLAAFARACADPGVLL